MFACMFIGCLCFWRCVTMPQQVRACVCAVCTVCWNRKSHLFCSSKYRKLVLAHLNVFAFVCVCVYVCVYSIKTPKDFHGSLLIGANFHPSIKCLPLCYGCWPAGREREREFWGYSWRRLNRVVVVGRRYHHHNIITTIITISASVFFLLLRIYPFTKRFQLIIIPRCIAQNRCVFVLVFVYVYLIYWKWFFLWIVAPLKIVVIIIVIHMFYECMYVFFFFFCYSNERIL